MAALLLGLAMAAMAAPGSSAERSSPSWLRISSPQASSTAYLAPLAVSSRHGLLRLKGGSEQESPFPPLKIANIAKFNNWDHRECSVENAEEWRNFMSDFLKKNTGIGEKIPKKIHQIWIGPKQPPIVWLDTWRKKYRSHYPGWEYKLWTDQEVAELQLRTQDLYDSERMYQCKADLLRLEILWREGGIYIDADMVWLQKDLQDVLDASKDTGFFCGYEPDTKDKPYSVIGNSFIACTPKHPLVDMLIKYIQGVYPHKRPYHGVEWVTGPLAFTKCISHTQMPWTVPPQVWFYPKFHYVPNPDAINLKDFPHSYAFQFGYTCSGLQGWVANSIRRCTLDNFWLDKCPQLKELEWPLGKLVPLPDAGSAAPGAKIPKVIHQFAFQGSKPERWIQSWAEEFCRQNEGWTYKCWSSMQELKGDYFCCNMYTDQPWQMDQTAMQLLALEVLYKHGGFHVPLSIPYSKESAFKVLAGDVMIAPSLDPSVPQTCFSQESIDKGFIEVEGLRIVGSAAGSSKCLENIKELIMMKRGSMSQRFLAYPDSVSAYLDFPTWTRFLGAEEMYDLCGSMMSDKAILSWSYDTMVPAYVVSRDHRSILKTTDRRFIAITNPEIFYYKNLCDEIPNFIRQMDEQHGSSWKFIVLIIQWEADEDNLALYQAPSGALPPCSLPVGLIANRDSGKFLPSLNVEQENMELITGVLSKFHELTVGVGSLKFVHDRQLAAIYRAIPSIQHAFKVLANHEPPLDHDGQERNGNTLKAMKNGQVRYELQVDQEHRASFRAFNDDGGMNCEIRLQDGHAGKRVDYVKVFFNHQLVLEKQNQLC